jgi:hypothetical protein
MRKIKKKRQVFLILFVFVLFSCSKDIDVENKNNFINENFVALSQVNDIANSILYPIKENRTKSENKQIYSKTVSNVAEIKNHNNKTSFYIVNYNEGGFVILSADKRTQPILGFSVSNKFVVEENSFPEGLDFWINDTKQRIADIQESNLEQTDNEEIAWRLVKEAIIQQVSTEKNVPLEDCYEHTETYTKGPLLNTRWYQTGGFNDDLQYISCNGSNFQVYAGCVPIAMAQVMKYHQHPTYYNWSAMPLDYATSTTASLISDIHDAIGNVYSGEPSYSCSATGVSTLTDMGSVLISQFNYSNAIKATYNYNTVKSNLYYNLPVLLAGSNASGGGHMWVCDGYTTTQHFFDDCTGISFLYFHMNWGWDDGAYNGYYAYNNFNPSNTNYNSNKRMVYNINP